MSSHQDPAPPGKMAIPRLLAPRPPALHGGNASSRTEKGRTELACINCRRRKVKCSGNLPKCEYCMKLDILCKYPPPRRDKLQIVTGQLEEALTLLKDLKLHQSREDQERIEVVLSVAHSEGDSPAPSPTNKRPRLSPTDGNPTPFERLDTVRGESMITADAGSNESLDVLEEDLIRDAKSRATGFIGKNSVVQWIRRLKLQIDLDNKGLTSQIPQTYGPPGEDEASFAARVAAGRSRRRKYLDDAQESISRSTYFMDDDPVDIYVEDAFYLPAITLAKHLFSCYMETVHQSFPILSKNEIELDFNSIFGENAQQDRTSFNMLAILNLVFAIGAKFSYLAYGDLHVGEQDHLRFSTKARKLGITESTFVEHPDLERVRILGLLSFYLFSIGQISRASNTMGLTVRLAFTLGLHVRNEDPVSDVRVKEARVRVWWSLYVLERLICTISGRPSVIADEDCSIFLPVPLEESQMDDDAGMAQLQLWFEEHSIGQGTSTLASTAPPKSIFFRATSQVAIITHKAVRDLYSAWTVTKSWEDTQIHMKRLKDELDLWAKNLPRDFTADPFRVGAAYQREARILTLMYWSAFIIITRPYVCRIDMRIEDQTPRSEKFNQYAASLCILAAKQIANLFPKEIDPTFPYKNGPWWFVVHNMMQAVTIFLLELYYRTHHVPGIGEKDDILKHLQKLVHWLKAMGTNDPLAYRGYKLIVAVARSLASQLGMSFAEMLGVEHEEEAAATQPPNDLYQDLASYSGVLPDSAHDSMQSESEYVQPGFEFPPGFEVPPFPTPFDKAAFVAPQFGPSSPLFNAQAQFTDQRSMRHEFGPAYGGQSEGASTGDGTPGYTNEYWAMFGGQGGAAGSSGAGEGSQEPPTMVSEYPGYLHRGT